MSAGSDFSLEVGVRVKDDASPAFQRIGRSAVESGRAVQSAGSSFGRFGDQASQGMRRSSQAIDGASRSWRTQMQRAGIEAGTAGGEGISRGVSSSARASSTGVQSAARTWRTEVSQAGESAGAAGGAGIATVRRKRAALLTGSLRRSDQRLRQPRVLSPGKRLEPTRACGHSWALLLPTSMPTFSSCSGFQPT